MPEVQETEHKTEIDKGADWFNNDDAAQAPRAAAVEPVVADAAPEPVATEPEEPSTIGSPDLFLTDRYKGADRVRILQVWADAEDRGYVIMDEASGNSRKTGYFEMHEGMDRAEAEAVLDRAYDGTAVVL